MKLLLLILLVPFSLFAGEMSFTVSPAIVKFETIQGSTKGFDLNFSNQSDSKLSVNTRVMDLVLDEKGVPVISKATKRANQWSKYVDLSNIKFVVKPGETKKIHVTLNTPRGKPGGGYFSVVFNAAGIKTSKKRSKSSNVMSIGGQLPSLFIGEISRTGKKKLSVKKTAINKAPYTKKHPFKIRYLVKNTGTTHAYVNGSVVIRDKKKVVARLKLKSGSGLIFPKGRRYFTAEWKNASKYSGKKLNAGASFKYKGGRLSKKTLVKIP
jgi:hypothetical protein